MGLDKRIGERFLNAGPGYGGSCFPKDTLALIHTADDYGMKVSIVDAVVESNRYRKQSMSEKITMGCGGESCALRQVRGLLTNPTRRGETRNIRNAPLFLQE